MIYVFDIDGTICYSKTNDYKDSKPILTRIEIINSLYDDGNTIIFNTARGQASGVDYTYLTREQLKKWGVKHHKLYMGKPAGDIYIDDKGITDTEFFKD
jgi:CMP-N,N'-diacetyllegionaminic acid synthase|tara:strand:- start:972 stop:1268 length:297 start_codon:yes stop_codon:yes gene_type:complete